jgi:hypothetical protein
MDKILSQNRSRLWMRVWQLVGLGLLLYGADHLIFIAILNSESVDLASRFVQGCLGLASWGLGIACLKRARKHKTVAAQQLIARDTRPPVLYLRPFRDDSTAGRVVGGGHLLLSGWTLGFSTEEEQMGAVLNAIGPFIAIGKPGEKLPELGAARTYVSDDQWQDAIAQEMARAALVVLRVGETEGLSWEVRTATEQVRPERLVLLIPANPKRYERFREMTQEYFPGGLPKCSGWTTKGSFGSLKGLIYFESDWTPRLVELTIPRFRRNVRKPLVPALKTALIPVFRQLNIQSSPVPINWSFTIFQFVWHAIQVLTLVFFFWIIAQAVWQRLF